MIPNFPKWAVPTPMRATEASRADGGEGDSEGVRVGAVRELPGLVQAARVFADGGLSLPEAAGRQGPGPSASAVATPSLATTYSACGIWSPASSAIICTGVGTGDSSMGMKHLPR
jgi:hypothetical protein